MKRLLTEFWGWMRPFFTPKMLPIFALAWFLTNGHAYMLLGIGLYWDISWMKWYGGSYLSILWLPITPEKLITIPIALFLYRIIYKEKFKKINPIQEEGEIK